MASKALKGLTIQIGADTSELNNALKDVDKRSSSLSQELNQINRLLKFNPTDTNLLAQKQKVLADAISTTEDRLGTLREAERQAQEQFEKGEITEEQYRALQREVISTEQKLGKLRRAAEETSEAMGKLGDETDDAKKGIKETGEAAEDAEDNIEELDGSLADAAKNGFTALAAAATAAVTAIVATAEASREYRTEMGKLNTAYTSSGYSADTAREAYEELFSVIGETDQSVEAAQQIALLANSAEDVAKWSNLAAGVVGRFGDALQPETFYEAANEVMKLGESTSAWTQMLEQSGVMTVDDFNEGLEKCNTEAEKQAYMLSVAEKALGSAAEQYKKTNKEVIRANAAAEDWNKAVADIGEEMEPVVTDIKEMGTALLKEAKEPMKQVADFVRSKLLPMLTKFSKWALNNLPEIGALIAGVAASTALYKAAALSAEMATKGLTVATILQQKAQKALNLIMKANPYVLLATAIVGVTTALLALNLASKEAVEEFEPLTEAERELVEAAKETAEAFREQKKATEEALANVDAEWRQTQKAADELRRLADESGRVAEKDQARADVLLGVLNDALGTEYQRVGDLIQGYGELTGSIDTLIQSKTANALIEEGNAAYLEALHAEADAFQTMELNQKAYLEQKEHALQFEQSYADQIALLRKRIDDAEYWSDYESYVRYQGDLDEIQGKIDAEWNKVAETEAAYNQSAADYWSYVETMETYDAALEAAANGNYEAVKDLLVKKGKEFSSFAGTVDGATAEVLETLKKEAVDAGIKAELTRKNFEDGVDGYTEEMVKEAEAGYAEAMDKFATAYADAFGVGNDVTIGIDEGMKYRKSQLMGTARGMIRQLISEMRKEADSHSPSRKTIALGEDIGEGAEIGIEKSTKGVERAAVSQVSAVLDAYRSQDVAGQNAFRNIAEQQASRAVAGQMTMASANGPMLEKILAAIEKGQVLMLDGDALVGATATKMDSALGRRHDLAAKGAI